MKNYKTVQQAIERLVQDTCTLVEHLTEIAKSRPELLIPIARKRIEWPCLVGHKRAFQKENAKLMQRIELGKETGFSEGQWRPNAPSTRRALWVYHWGLVFAKKWGLPQKITKENKHDWFDQAWDHALEEFNFEPLKDPELAKIGKTAIKRNINASAEDQLEEIKKQVKKAFNGLIAAEK